MEIESSRTLYVYVISYDDLGEQYLLFPMNSSDIKNPLPHNEKIRLPGTRNGMQLVWNVTSSGGREHVVVIASPKQLKEFEGAIEVLNTPGYARLPIDATRRLRGIGGIGEHPLPHGNLKPTDLFRDVAKLASASKLTRGPWVRQIDLMYAP